MIDVNEARCKLLKRWRQNRFEELDEPDNTKEYSYIAMRPKPEDYEDDFDFLFWEPALIALEKAVIEDDAGKFYKVEVYYDDDILIIASSCSKYPQPPKPESIIEYDELVKMVFKTGGGVIPCGEHLGVFASTQANVSRCPPGWVFVNMETATLDTLQEAVNVAKKGRASWPKQD